MAKSFITDRQKTWREIAEAGVLPGIIGLAGYQARYEENLEKVEAFLADFSGPVTAPADVKRAHALLFEGIAPWGRQFWAVEIGGMPGVDPTLAEQEFKLLGAQVSRLLPHAETETEQLRLIAFYHARFETIHAFRDGNGRLGRLLAHHALHQLLGHGALCRVERDEYLQALLRTSKFDALSPLSDVLHRAYLRRNDPVGYVPTPFQMPPQRSAGISGDALVMQTVMDRPEMIKATSPPLVRRWFGGFALEDLLTPGRRYVATRTLAAARAVLDQEQAREQSVGEAIEALARIQRLKPYRPYGWVFAELPESHYIDVAKLMLSPALCNMTRESGYRIIDLIEGVFDGTAEHTANDVDEAYQSARYAMRPVALEAFQTKRTPEYHRTLRPSQTRSR